MSSIDTRLVLFEAMDRMFRAASSSDHGPDELILDPQALNSLCGQALFDSDAIGQLRTLCASCFDGSENDKGDREEAGVLAIPSNIIRLYGDLLVKVIDVMLESRTRDAPMNLREACLVAPNHFAMSLQDYTSPSIPDHHSSHYEPATNLCRDISHLTAKVESMSRDITALGQSINGAYGVGFNLRGYIPSDDIQKTGLMRQLRQLQILQPRALIGGLARSCYKNIFSARTVISSFSQRRVTTSVGNLLVSTLLVILGAMLILSAWLGMPSDSYESLNELAI